MTDFLFASMQNIKIKFVFNKNYAKIKIEIKKEAQYD